ncbi:MAG: hypothetical protein A3G93_01260 [Nitrospinae bacterium RIFCSPLOWO2_12_FULL_45_22]|nr:MAG: hypothetical protein A3G93_01260 [Nitrospinae bacterium RIFCSPLOWO2_12_FULL_45_22]
MFSKEKLKKIRTEKRLTRKKLAEITGLHLMTIASYEAGTREPKAEPLRRIAKAFKLSMEDFFDDEEEPIEVRPLEPIVEKIKEVAERRRLTLPKDIYPLFLFQEALGIEDNEVFAHILLALARGRIIELIPIFPRDIKEGMKVYQVPELGKKKYYSFTMTQRG